MNVVGWSAWFTSGRVFHSTTSTWAALPDQGVLLVMVFYDSVYGKGVFRRRGMRHGRDHYVMVPPGAKGTEFVNTNELVTSLAVKYPSASVKFGKMVSNEEMDRVQTAAFAARAWPPVV